MTAIELSRLDKRFGSIRALDSVDLLVPTGSLYGIIGPNGSGKTTLINCLSGVVTPDRGSIVVYGTDVTTRRGHAIARLGLRRTFQHGRLAPDLTVYENVALGTHDASVSASARRRRILHACELTGVAQLCRRRASELVWAERQRVQLARAICAEPRVLLLDEPTAGLGTRESAEILEIVRGLHRSGVTILLVSHDVHLLLSAADRISVLDSGRVIANGDPQDIRHSATVREAYLGAS